MTIQMISVLEEETNQIWTKFISAIVWAFHSDVFLITPPDSFLEINLLFLSSTVFLRLVEFRQSRNVVWKEKTPKMEGARDCVCSIYSNYRISQKSWTETSYSVGGNISLGSHRSK